jgi:hypothetical protein
MTFAARLTVAVGAIVTAGTVMSSDTVRVRLTATPARPPTSRSDRTPTMSRPFCDHQVVNPPSAHEGPCVLGAVAGRNSLDTHRHEFTNAHDRLQIEMNDSLLHAILTRAGARGRCTECATTR